MPSTRLYGPSIATPSPASGVPAINVQAAKGVVPLPATLTTGTSTAEAMVPNPATPTLPLLVQVPSNSSLEQRVWEFESSGYIVTGGTTNVTLKLYSGTSLTPGSNTLMGSSGTVAQNSAKAPYWVHAKAVYDSVSGKIGGSVDFMINNTMVAAVAFSSALSAILDTNNPVLSLGISITCSGGFSTNAINVQDLCIKF
jgi:hypothetical protein